MPGLAHSAVSPLPGNLPLTQLCLPLTRHRNNSPAFSCKFHLSRMETSSTCTRKHNKRPDEAGLGGLRVAWQGQRGSWLPLPRSPLRAGVTIPVPPCPQHSVSGCPDDGPDDGPDPTCREADANTRNQETPC